MPALAVPEISVVFGARLADGYYSSQSTASYCKDELFAPGYTIWHCRVHVI
jgi:hypothetical protein